MEELIIGSHVSFKKDDQLLGSIKEGLSYNSNAIMLYTGAPQNTMRMPINEELTKQGHELMKKNNIDINNIIVHAPYIINLASEGEKSLFASEFLKQELKRVEQLGLNKIVLHPGNHVNLGSEAGIKNIIKALNLAMMENSTVTICLESMAGKGTECGKNFYELKQIIDGVNDKDHIAVCLDTCHLNDAGYLMNEFDEVLNQFDKIIGLDKLKCIHINDSKNEIESHKDRHENFGFGTIGFDSLIHIVYHPSLKGIPKILETPYVSEDENSTKRLYPPYKFEIQMIRNKKFDPNLIEKIRKFYK